jgi:hypothetical protein
MAARGDCNNGGGGGECAPQAGWEVGSHVPWGRLYSVLLPTSTYYLRTLCYEAGGIFPEQENSTTYYRKQQTTPNCFMSTVRLINGDDYHKNCKFNYFVRTTRDS